MWIRSTGPLKDQFTSRIECPSAAVVKAAGAAGGEMNESEFELWSCLTVRHLEAGETS